MKSSTAGFSIVAILLATAASADFSDFDTDGDGRLTEDEVTAQFENNFAEGDTNGDGSISAEELLDWAGVDVTDTSLDQAKTMLERIDGDNDGQVGLDDFEARSANVSDTVARVDTDGDGEVSQTERDEARAEARSEVEAAANDARDRVENKVNEARERLE